MKMEFIVLGFLLTHQVISFAQRPGFIMQPVSYDVRNISQYKVTVQLRRFMNPDHTKSDGEKCDMKNIFYKDQLKCDHLFLFCTRKEFTSNNEKVCTQSAETQSTEVITFQEVADLKRMGTHQLRQIEHYKGYGGKLLVTDDDERGHEFIDEFDIKFSSNETNTTKIFSGRQINTKVKVGVLVTCDDYYYGDNCTVYCKMAGEDNCTCTSNGTLYCYIKDDGTITTITQTSTATVAINASANTNEVTTKQTSIDLLNLTNQTTSKTSTPTTIPNHRITISNSVTEQTTTGTAIRTTRQDIGPTLTITFKINCSKILDSPTNEMKFEEVLKGALSNLSNGSFKSEQVELREKKCGSLLVTISINVENQTAMHEMVAEKIEADGIQFNLTLQNGNQTEILVFQTKEIAPNVQSQATSRVSPQSTTPQSSRGNATKQPVKTKSINSLAIGLGIAIPCAVIIIGAFVGVRVKKRIRKSRRKRLSTGKSLTYDNKAYSGL